MGGKSGQTIGYHYIMSTLSGLCRGPIDELCAISADDKKAWTGQADDGSLQAINVPKLFGGEKEEGGLQGLFRVNMGAPDQIIPGAESGSTIGPLANSGRSPLWSLTLAFFGGPYPSGTLPDLRALIASKSGGTVSQLRGVVTVWYDGLIASMNPYPKPWKFRLRRTNKGWWNDDPFYPAKAAIYIGAETAGGDDPTTYVKAMNPAHILYEICTNPEWGRGIPRSFMNDASFIYAANTLCDEGFGLCLMWYRKEPIKDFIQTVLDHVGATMYVDRETGLITMRMIRGDYDPNTIPLFTPSTGLLSIEEDTSASSDVTVSEVVCTGHDPRTNKDIEARSQNIAAWQAQGVANSLPVSYPGIPDKALLQRLADRDLKIHASGLKKYIVRLDRRAWRLPPGAVFRISDPRRNVSNVILRAAEIDDGKMIDGVITVKTMQDVFSLASTSYITPVEGGWTPPVDLPGVITNYDTMEASYRDANRLLSPADFNTITEDDAFVAGMAAPTDGGYQYVFSAKADGETDYGTASPFGYTPTFTITSTITPLDTTFTIANVIGEPPSVGEALRVGDEIMRVDAVSDLDLTVARGCVDTIPQTHSVNARGWCIDDEMSTDGRTYVTGDIVDSQFQSKTVAGTLSETLASHDTVTMIGRFIRPYPPADVKVDGTSIYSLSGLYTEPTITFVDRNRVAEADQLVSHTESGVTAEAGTTYNLVVKLLDNTVLRTEVISSGWQYDSTMQTTDGSPAAVKMTLESERDGYPSWQHYQFTVGITVDPLAVPAWVEDLRAPSGDLPIIALDFENERYWRSDTNAEILESDMLEQNDDWGYYTAGQVAPGLGLTDAEIGTTVPVGGHYGSYGVFKSDIATLIGDEVSVVMKQSCPTNTGWSYFFYTDLPDYTAQRFYQGHQLAVNILIYAYEDGVQDIKQHVVTDATALVPFKTAFTIEQTRQALSKDGAAIVTLSNTTMGTPYTHICIGAPGTDGTDIGYLQSLVVYPVQPDADLPTLST